MAVKTGVPIEELTSLSALLAPEIAEKVLDAYWQQNGDNPKLFTIDLAVRFLSIARETKCLDEAACERLDEMRQDLERSPQWWPHRQEYRLPATGPHPWRLGSGRRTCLVS